MEESRVLLIHSAQLIPLEAPPNLLADLLSLHGESPESGPPRGETERQVTSGHHPSFFRRDKAGGAVVLFKG